MSKLTILTNSLQVSDVIVRDLGIIIPGNGLYEEFDTSIRPGDIVWINKCKASKDLSELSTDDLYGANGSTLIIKLNDIEIDPEDFFNATSSSSSDNSIIYNVYKSDQSADQLVLSGPDIVKLDMERNVVSGFILNSDRVQLNNSSLAGKYQINGHVTGVATNAGGGGGGNNSKANYEIFLTLNGTEITGSRGRIFLNNNNDGDDSTVMVEIDLALNDMIDIRVVRINGTYNMDICSNSAALIFRKVG